MNKRKFLTNSTYIYGIKLLTFLYIFFTSITISKAQAYIPDSLPDFNTPHFAQGKVNFKIDNNSSAIISMDSIPKIIQAIVDKYHITSFNKIFKSNDSILARVYTLNFEYLNNTTGYADSVLTDSLVADLQKISFVEYAEKVFIGNLFYSPNDPYYTFNQYIQLLNINDAWDMVLPGNSNTSPVIAIIDNSFLNTHTDLIDNNWINLIENNSGTPNFDDDGNGYADDINGWDFGNNDATLFSSANGCHGTHVSSIAGARTNNGLGVSSAGDPGASAGQGFHPRLMFIKVFEDGVSSFSTNNLAAGIEYAVNNGANIINMSLGGPFTTTYPAIIQTAIDNAYSHGVLCVAAAGNDGALSNRWPCGLNHVMCVGATKLSDQITDFSNFGPQIDVMAPGEYIYGCDVDNLSDYITCSGTSMATPIVSGIAALIKNKFPYVPSSAIESCIENTCVNIENINHYPLYELGNPPYDYTNNSPNELYNNNLGHGRVDALSAIQCIQSNIGNISCLPVNPCPSEPTVLFYYSNSNLVSYQWTITPAPQSINSTTIQMPEVVFGALGTYTITLNAISDQNIPLTVTTTLNITNLPTATISSLNNLSETCSGSSQSIFVQFTGHPPFNLVLSDGNQTYTFSNLQDFQSTVYLDIFEDFNTISVINVSDLYCDNPDGNEISFTNIVKCCPNLIDNGDFEDHQSWNPAEYPTSTSPGIFHFYSDYQYGNGQNAYLITDYSPAQHGSYYLSLDGYAELFPSTQAPSQGIDANIWKSMSIPVKSNQNYYFSFWVTNPWSSEYYTENNLHYAPGIRLYINGQQMTFGNLAQPQNFYYAPVNPNRWTHLCGVWNSGTNTSMYAELKNLLYSGNGSSGANGNDINIDNIEFRCIDNFDIQASEDILICAGSSIASLTTTTTEGSQPYSYIWSPVTGLSQDDISNPTANPTVTTTYIVSATDNNGCSASDDVTVFVNDIFITPSSDATICSGESMTLSTTGGGTYLWSTSETTSSIYVTPTITTTYVVTVTATNGCIGTGSITLTVNPLPNVDAGPDAYVGLCNSTLIGPTGIIPNTTFSWSPINTLNNPNIQQPTASPLITTTYTLTETFPTTGCAASDYMVVYYIEDPMQLSVVDVKCYNESTGSASISINGGTPPYTYVWSNGDQGATISNISAGTYQVTTTDAVGCTQIYPVIINQPSQGLTCEIINPTKVSCYGYADAEATAIASGGTAPYSYLWSSGSTAQTAVNLSAQSYTVTITDALGCSCTSSFIIEGPEELTVSITSTNINCNGSNTGSAQAFVSGGTAPYEYDWSNGSPTSTNNNLSAGTYEVTVTDFNHCTATALVTITEPAEPLTLETLFVTHCCLNQQNGSFKVLAHGGTPPYIYTPAQYMDHLPAGTYTVTVTDANDCSVNTTITVLEPENEMAFDVSIQSNCIPNNNGSANLNGVTNAWEPITSIVWSNGVTGSSITGVASGTYYVTITDAYGCTGSAQVIIDNAPMNITGTYQYICDADYSGSILTTVACGNAPYTYLWSNGATTQNVSNLTTGVYTVTVTDNDGQTATQSFEIVQPIEQPDLGLYITSSCNTGQYQPYTIQNYDPDVAYTWSISPSSAGTFWSQGNAGQHVEIAWNTSGTAYIVINCYNPISGCEEEFTYEYHGPCATESAADYSICNQSATNLGFSNGATFTGLTFEVNGYFTIDKNLSFTDCNFYMGPLAYIQMESATNANFSGCIFLVDPVCENMWNGIYNNYDNSIVNISNSKINDAIDGLVSSKGGQYVIYGNTFEKNYKCLQVSEYIPASGILNVTISHCYLTGSSSLPYPPHAGSPSSTGITITDIGSTNATTGIVIGNTSTSADRNYIKNFQTGLYAERSNIKVYNNQFSSTGVTMTGMFVNGSNQNLSGKNTVIIGENNTNRLNQFNNLVYGIRAFSNMDLTATGNSFDGCTSSIEFYNLGHTLSATNNVTINYNTINNGASVGIAGFANSKCSASISCNTITMIDNDNNKGIYISGSSISNSNEIYTINTNSISAFNGIIGHNTYKINGNSNNITMHTNNTFVKSYGIQMLNCDYQDIINSSITGTTTRTRRIGITIENTTHPYYRNNTIQYADWAFNVVGINSNASKVVSIYQNHFKYCNKGLVKNAGTTFTAGIMGNQGNTNTPSLNRWTSVTTHVGTLSGTVVTEAMWIRNSTNYPLENFNVAAGFSKPISQCNPCTITSTPVLICLDSPLNKQEMISASSLDTVDTSISSTAIEFQRGLLRNTYNFDNNNWFLAKQHIYSQIRPNESQYSNEPDMLDFLKACNQNSIGLLYQADRFIGHRQADSAEYINNLINPEQEADAIHQTVNKYYIAYLRGQLTSTDIQELSEIASLCPFEYGDGVYIARGLINTAQGTTKIYQSSCETDTDHLQNTIASNDPVVSDNDFQIRLYPNPADDEVIIEYFNENDSNEDIRITIVNLTGSVLIDQKIEANVMNKLSMASLSPGVYFYRVCSHDKVLETDKLVIIR